MICDVTPGGCIRSRFAVLCSVEHGRGRCAGPKLREQGLLTFFYVRCSDSSLLQTGQRNSDNNFAEKATNSTRGKHCIQVSVAAPLRSDPRRINSGLLGPEPGRQHEKPRTLQATGISISSHLNWVSGARSGSPLFPFFRFRSSQQLFTQVTQLSASGGGFEPPCLVQQRNVSDLTPTPSIATNAEVGECTWQQSRFNATPTSCATLVALPPRCKYTHFVGSLRSSDINSFLQTRGYPAKA